MVLSEISPFLQDFGTEALAFMCVCVCALTCSSSYKQMVIYYNYTDIIISVKY